MLHLCKSGPGLHAQAHNRFIEMGILSPKDKDKKYGQSYIYKKYTDIFADSK